MFHRYDYEAEFYPALSRLPLDLRRKLDVTGIKISLKHWLAYSMEERAVLCHLPCNSDDEKEVFLRYLDFLSKKYLGQPTEKTAAMSAALWGDSVVPDAVVEKSHALHQTVTLEEWRRWQSHQRYAVYKTAVSKSQPEAFELVLRQLRNLVS